MADVSLAKLSSMWLLLDRPDDKWTLVQVMAWCRQQQAITWASVDPDICRHMASLGPYELTGYLMLNCQK